MTELDHILEVHRREQRAAEHAIDLVLCASALIVYGVVRLVVVLW